MERNYAREVRPISFVRRRFDPGKVPQKHSFPLERIVGQQSAIKCSEVGFQCSAVLCGVLCGVHIVECYVEHCGVQCGAMRSPHCGAQCKDIGYSW